MKENGGGLSQTAVVRRKSCRGLLRKGGLPFVNLLYKICTIFDGFCLEIVKNIETNFMDRPATSGPSLH